MFLLIVGTVISYLFTIIVLYPFVFVAYHREDIVSLPLPEILLTLKAFNIVIDHAQLGKAMCSYNHPNASLNES